MSSLVSLALELCDSLYIHVYCIVPTNAIWYRFVTFNVCSNEIAGASDWVYCVVRKINNIYYCSVLTFCNIVKVFNVIYSRHIEFISKFVLFIEFSAYIFLTVY